MIAIIFTYLILSRQFKKRKNEIETRNRLLTLESSSKLNQLKPHFIFNALMPLQNYILKSDKDNALNYLKAFSTLTRSMLTISRSSYVSIHEEIAFLNNYLSVQQTEKSNAFEFTIENQLPFDLCRANIMPTLLLQPITENAIDHGMTRDVKQKGSIRICFAPFDEQHFKVSILDNGPGFSPEKKQPQSKNHALSIIEERISLMRKRTDLTQLQYTLTPAGFQITIILPINPHT
jgi:LytS/YehU family sensor histidine kinase